jgi:hypothetical protein
MVLLPLLLLQLLESLYAVVQKTRAKTKKTARR